MNGQIEEMCAIMADAVYAACEDTPLVPESAGICDKVSCNRCKEARRLMNADYRKASDVAREIFEAIYGISIGCSVENDVMRLTFEKDPYVLVVLASEFDKLRKKYESEGGE